MSPGHGFRDVTGVTEAARTGEAERFWVQVDFPGQAARRAAQVAAGVTLTVGLAARPGMAGWLALAAPVVALTCAWAYQRATGCWLWCGARDRYGYGRYGVKGASGRWGAVLAHRWAWMWATSRVLAGDVTLDHLCHTRHRSCDGGVTCPHRRCVRPDHLEPVSQAENQRRRRCRTTAKEAT